MRLGIMQPYFMPYLGYFSLIKYADEFILFDIAQFIRHGWIERNKILKPNGEPLYIKVPLKKHSRNTSIKDVQINNSVNWKDKILAQLVPYKKKAPHYWKVISLLQDIFSKKTESITELNQIALQKICNYLNITTPIKVWSGINVTIEEANAADEWALNICKALNANEYINPPGGKSFFDHSKFNKEGLKLSFLELEAKPYKQLTDSFVPFLSIIDVLMFCNIEETNNLIMNYNIV